MISINRNGISARIATYIAKLALFLAVPGLHMLASRYRIAGTAIFLIYGLSVTAAGKVMIDPTRIYFVSSWITFNLVELMPFLYVPFLIIDRKNIGNIVVSRKILLLAASFFVLINLPIQLSSKYYLHFEYEDFVCPTVCDGDVVVYDYYWDNIPSDRKISVGDLVVANEAGDEYVTKIVATSGQAVCTQGGTISERPSSVLKKCQNLVTVKDEHYLVIGGNTPMLQQVDNTIVSLIHTNRLLGVNPVVVGKSSEILSARSSFMRFSVLSLATLYETTNINLVEPVLDFLIETRD